MIARGIRITPCVAGFSEIIGCFLALHFTLKHNKWKWQYAGTFNILAGMLGCLGWLFSGADESEYPNIYLYLLET